MTYGLRVFKALSWNLFEKAGLFLINFLISIFLARVLKPHGYGLYASLMSIAALLPIVISLGFVQILNVYVPKFNSEGERNKISFLLRRVLLIRAALSFILSVLVYLFGSKFAANLSFNKELIFYFKYIAIYVFFENFIDIFNSLYIGLLNIRRNAFVNISSRFLCFLLLIYFLQKGYGLNGVFYSLIISALFSIFIYLGWSFKYFRGPGVAFSMLEPYKLGLISWCSVIINFFLGKNSDILIMNFFKIPNAQIGFYNLAFSLTMLISFLTIGTGPISQSVFAESMAKGGIQRLSLAWNSFIKLLTFSIFPIFVFFFIHTRQILSIFYTTEYLPATSLFRTYAVLTVIYTMIGSSQCVPVFYVLGKRKFALYLMAPCALLNLGINLILIPRFGAMGAIVGTGSCYLLMGAIGMLIVRRHIRFDFPKEFYLKVVIASVSAVLFTFFIKNASILSLISNISIYALTVSVMLYFLKPFESAEREYFRSQSSPLFLFLARF